MLSSKYLLAEIKSIKDLIKHHAKALFEGEEETILNKNKPTIMLLHGYLVGALSMQGQARYFQKRGFNARCENYAFWENLRKVETDIGKDLEKICQEVEAKVSLIGHSLGGLVAYALAQNHPELVNRVITLGTPFQGTHAARIGYVLPKRFSKSALQMIPGSNYLQELKEKGHPQVPVVSIHSQYDELVIPWKSAKLEKGSLVYNVNFSAVGHGGLMTSLCYLLVEEWLRKDLTKDL